MRVSRRELLWGGLVLGLPAMPFGAARASGQMHEIAIQGFTFEPVRLSVQIGDRIRVTNHDLAPHTATALDESWDTGTLTQGESVALEVTSEWGAEFFCRHHPNMTGSLIIG